MATKVKARLKKIAKPQGRPRGFKVEKVLSDSIAIFRERGYSGTSIQNLERATGLTVGSLYKAFRSKREIFSAAFEMYVRDRHTLRDQRLLVATNAREKIAALIGFYIDSATGAEGRSGCMVAGGLVESSILEEDMRSALSDALVANYGMLLDLLREGRQDGSVPVEVSAEDCAELLLSLLQGFRVVGKLRDPNNREALIALALKMIA